MRTIWKFDVPMNVPLTPTMMPSGARIIAVHEQNGAPMVWAEVDPAAPKEPRYLRIVVTGGTVLSPPFSTYIGTVFIDWFVGHIYEETRPTHPTEEERT
jgi:hypothetical protein